MRVALPLATAFDSGCLRQVYVGGEFIGGCDTTVEMFKSGELRKMLVEVGAKEE